MQGTNFSGRTSIVGLDLIRFFAATAVMWFHFAYRSGADPNRPSGKIPSGLVDDHFLAATSWWGWVGVYIFFVISGFVITYSADGKSAAAFFRSRFLRLYPAAWICASITLVVLVIVGETSDLGVRYLKSITLFPLQPWVDRVYWTLGVEMSFYGLVFLLLWRNRFSDLPYLLSSIGLISSVMWIGWFVSGYDFSIFRHTRLSELLLIPFGCHFAIGGFIWLHTRQRLSWRMRIIFCICGVGGSISVYSLSLNSEFSPIVPVTIWVTGTLAVFLAVSFNERITKSLGAYSRLIRMIGLSTYPLYLIHDIVGGTIIYWSRLLGLNQIFAMVVGVFTMTGLSILIATTLEPLLRGWTSRILALLFMNISSST